MSASCRMVVFFFVFSLSLLTSCGGGPSGGITNPTAPPTGKFSNANLSGTYVFSTSGIDVNGSPYALVGEFTANGKGGISGGTLDVNNSEFSAPQANVAIGSNSNYSLQIDGRGRVTLNAPTQFGSSIVLDVALEDSSHGLVIQFDGNATGSGTIDAQVSGAMPSGAYAFSLAGGAYSSGTPVAVVGNFTLGNGGSLNGLEDVNEGVSAFPDLALTGSLVPGPTSSPSTTLASSGLSATFDVFTVDPNHLKFIEMDQTATLEGDAYSQTTTVMPSGNLVFTLAGVYPFSATTPAYFAAGGVMVADAAGNINNASTEDYNESGSVSPTASPSFSANYTATGAGRYTLNNFSGFVGGSNYAAYPSSGGILLLEIDSSGVTAGAAYPQTSGASLAASQGFALNLSGTNLNGVSSYYGGGSPVEIDDVAEFATTGGGKLTGVLDENYAPGGGANFGIGLTSGAYSAPDSNGRGQLSTAAGNGTAGTLNGGFNLVYYAVDGNTFPFIEADTAQVASGVFFEQNPTGSSAAIRSQHMFVAPPILMSHGSLRQQK